LLFTVTSTNRFPPPTPSKRGLKLVYNVNIENVVYYLGQIATDRIGLHGQWKGGVKAVVDIRPTNRKQAPATMACST